jgi:ADP-ribosyl-[dinitrogen reductase] hydrolase
LMGLCVGDALGATHEGRRLQAPMFPELCGGVYTDIVGGGPFKVRPGQVTDDTQMATCLATGLRNLKRYDLFETAKEYARWVPFAFDIGPETKAALALVAEGRSPEATGRRIWLDARPRPASNDSLSRTTPIGIFFYKEQPRRIEASLLDSAITHFDPRCQLACVVHNAVLAASIASPNEKASNDEILKQIEADLSIAAAQLGKNFPEHVTQVTDAAEWLREDVRLAQDSDPLLYGPEIHILTHEKYVRTALRLALWELFHAPDFEQALIDVINRGGDADTNAAICGAMYGARVGESAIPQRWAGMVMDALPDSTAPLAQQYHPRALMQLVGEAPDAQWKPSKPERENLMGMIKG